MRDCYRIRCGQLKSNGLRFYTRFSNIPGELPVIGVMAGSIHDPPHRRGLAHLTEHCLLDGSESYSKEDVGRLIERTTAGNLFVETHKTFTLFGPGDVIKRNHAREQFRMFSSMMRDRHIDYETLETEKAAIHQEYLERSDVAEIKIVEDLFEIIFPKNYLARIPEIGRLGEVRRSSLRDIQRFLRRHYHASKIFVINLGIKHKEAGYLIENELGQLNGNGQINQPLFTLPRTKGGYRPLRHSIYQTKIHPGLQQYHVAIGIPTETYFSDDADYIDVLAKLLSVRMFKRLRGDNRDWEKGAYGAFVFTDRSFAHGIIWLQFSTSDKSFARYGAQIFNEECRHLCNYLVNPNDLEVAVGYMIDYEYRNTFQCVPADLLLLIANAVANGDLDLSHIHSKGERLQKILRREGRPKLREVARKYLRRPFARLVYKPN